MAWKLEFTSSADKALSKLPTTVQRRIVHALDDLLLDPYASRNVKALQGRSGYRLRVGEYRVIYRLEKDRLVIVVIEVAIRQGAY